MTSSEKIITYSSYYFYKMVTTIALIRYDFHNFNNNLKLTHIVSLHNNSSCHHS